LLEKLTWGFIVAIMVLCLSTSFINPNRPGSTNDILEDAANQVPQQSTPGLNLQNLDTETDSAAE